MNRTAVMVMWLLAGCTDNSSTKLCTNGNGDACITLPIAPLLAVKPDMTTTAPTLGCGALAPVNSQISVTAAGVVVDYQNPTTHVGSVTLSVFTQPDFTNNVAMATTAADGSFTMTIPSGTPDVLFVKAGGAPNYSDVSYANLLVDLSHANLAFNPAVVKTDGIATIYSLVRETPDPAKATIAIAARDCMGYALEHATATLSSTPGKRSLLAGAGIYYTAAGALPLPVLTSIQQDTNSNGAIAAANVPVSTGSYIQIWGWPDATAQGKGENGLVLVAEYPLTVSAGELLSFQAPANK